MPVAPAVLPSVRAARAVVRLPPEVLPLVESFKTPPLRTLRMPIPCSPMMVRVSAEESLNVPPFTSITPNELFCRATEVYPPVWFQVPPDRLYWPNPNAPIWLLLELVSVPPDWLMTP